MANGFISFHRLGKFGRLGNQLFQIAATVGTAEKFGKKAVFPEWKSAYAFQGPFDQTLDMDLIENVYSEISFAYAPIPDLPNLDLQGYFQSWRYFHHCKDLIRQMLVFSHDPLPHLPHDRPDISETWAIHVRRGDYLNLKQYYLTLDMDYYCEAMNVARELGARNFLVFSDDPEWCRHNFPGDVDFVDGLDDAQSLCLMSKCGHHIIANSSFSWWGSWLCQNPQQKIIAPHSWFNGDGSKHDTSDLYRPEWHLLASGKEHSQQFPTNSDVGSSMRDREDGTTDGLAPTFPLNIYRQMRQIEPLLPDSSILPTLAEYVPPRGWRLGKAYFKLADLIAAPFSHLFVLPGLHRSDADFVALDYIKLVAARLGAQAPLVVLTLDSHSTAVDGLPEGVRVIKLDDLVPRLTGEDKVQIVARLILQAAPKVVHNINSEACWTVYARYHRQIGKLSKLVAHLFPFAYDVDGVPAGHTAKFLNRCIDNLDLLLCDNQSLIGDLQRIYALEDNNARKIFVTYAPNRLVKPSRVWPPSSRNILLAKPIASEKTLTMLAAIAQRLPDYCFKFWGRPSYGNRVLEQLNHLPNVELCGPCLQFEQVLSIDLAAFLYLDEAGGLPNILLDAMAAGLAVVAPNVGAVAELVTDSTGWLIEDGNDVDSFVQAIREALENEMKRNNRLAAAAQLLEQRHTWTAFVQAVEAAGYWVS